MYQLGDHTVGNYIIGQLPNIYGKIEGDTFNNSTSNPGAIYWTGYNVFSTGIETSDHDIAAYQQNGQFLKKSVIYFDARNITTVYGGLNNDETGVVPRSLSCLFCIKFNI